MDGVCGGIAIEVSGVVREELEEEFEAVTVEVLAIVVEDPSCWDLVVRIRETVEGEVGHDTDDVFNTTEHEIVVVFEGLQVLNAVVELRLVADCEHGEGMSGVAIVREVGSNGRVSLFEA